MAKKTKTDVLPNDLVESVHKVWLAGLGALSAAEEEGGKLFRSLVEKGQELEKKREESVGRIKDVLQETATTAKEQATFTRERVESTVDEQVARALGRLGVPSQDEIAQLTEKVEELTKAVEALKAPAAKAPVKKAAPKKRAAKPKTSKPN